jgi:hypothetical protein
MAGQLGTPGVPRAALQSPPKAPTAVQVGDRRPTQ